MQIINELNDKLNYVSQKIPKNEWKFFHRCSIKNFILYIDCIKDKTEKENASKFLIDCLKDVEYNFKPDIEYSMYLFNNYLKGVVSTYQNRLGFWPVPNKNALIVYLIAIVLVFMILLNNFYLGVLFCSILILFLMKMLIVIRKHKIFGFRY